MKPRLDTSGAFVRPMTSAGRSEIFGCTFIRSSLERSSLQPDNTPLRPLLHRHAGCWRAAPGGGVGVFELRFRNVCGESSAAMPQEEHEVAENRWPIGYGMIAGGAGMGRLPKLFRLG